MLTLIYLITIFQLCGLIVTLFAVICVFLWTKKSHSKRVALVFITYLRTYLFLKGFYRFVSIFIPNTYYKITNKIIDLLNFSDIIKLLKGIIF